MKPEKTIAALLVLCLGLCACAGSAKAPESTRRPYPSVSPAVSSLTEEDPAASFAPGAQDSTMRIMQLTSLEQFYLDSLSSGMGNMVYEIQLAEDFTTFKAHKYYYCDSRWRESNWLNEEISGETCYFAVKRSLDNFGMAFKSGGRSANIIESPIESAYGSSSANIAIQKNLIITEGEIPLIAFRRYDMEGGPKLASLQDFYAPEDVDAGEIEEYYILTVEFIKES